MAGDEALLAATEELTTKVEELSGHLTVSRDQADRIQRQVNRVDSLSRAVLGIALLALLGVFLTGLALVRAQGISDDNKDNAIINCQNANQSRAGNLSLWNFILDKSAEANPNQTPEQRQVAMDLRDWVAKLYAQRDCSDLSRKYELPPPPTSAP